MEAREKRLQEREAAANAQAAATASQPSLKTTAGAMPPGGTVPGPGGVAQATGPVTAVGGYPIVSPADALKAVEINAAREQKEKNKKAAETGAQTTSSASTTSNAGSGSDKSVASSFLFRDSAPTLNKQQFEVSQELSYTRNETQLQHDRSLLSVTSLRYGIVEGVEVGLTIPAYASQRSTQLDPVYRDDIRALGDISLQATTSLWKPALWYPGAALATGVTLPTATQSPYLIFPTLAPGQDPRNPLATILGQQHWAGSGLIQFFKTFDPVVLFMGFGTQYTFSRDIGNFRIQPGMRYIYNFGLSVALSEYSTLGFSFIGSLDEPLKLNGVNAGTGASEQARARFVLVQRVNPDLFIEPSITHGLTNSTPAVTMSLGARQRF